MLSAIATLVLALVTVLFPVLIPAATTTLHTIAQVRRRRQARAAEPVSASA